MSEHYDVIVVGGGPGGATAAGYLTRMGRKTLLLEKEDGPRHRVGESLLPSMMPILDDFGLIDEVEACGFPHKTGGTFVWGKSREPWDVLFSNNPFLPYPYAYHVDRAVFDEILVRDAVRNGVTLRRGFAVRHPLKDETGRVVGVSGADRDGTRHEFHARFVIDATGVDAVLARKLTNRQYDERMKQVAFYTYYKDVDGPKGVREGHVLIETNPWGWFWYIPMVGDLGDASVGLVSGQEFKEEYRQLGPEAFFDRAMEEAPYMKELLGPRATKVRDTAAVTDWAFTSEQTAGPGFFLVGDAAAFLDPLLSTGATMAMLAGYSASVCINSCFDDPSVEAEAASFYDQNYQRMWEQTRDFLHYFYAGNALADKDDIFWKARSNLNLGDNVAACQAFCFLVNTIPGNPHPALRKQIHMYMQFMDQLDHPLDEMEEEAAIHDKIEEPTTQGWDDLSLSTLSDATIPVCNGDLERSWMIDGDNHLLKPVRGLTYDQSRPVFSSTSSWLLGRNIHPLDEASCDLLERMDGTTTWGDLLNDLAASKKCSLDDARAGALPLLDALCRERLVLLRTR